MIDIIAKKAKVSRSTVYRVIKNDPAVAISTAEQVRKVMSQLSFKPTPYKAPAASRGKKRSQTGTRNVGFILSGLPDHALGRPHLLGIIKGVETLLREHGINMILTRASHHKDFPPIFDEGKVDGIIFYRYCTDIQPDMQRHLRSAPLVWMQDAVFDYGDEVLPNHEISGRLAAAYLLEKGHTHLAYLNPIRAHIAFRLRGQTFQSVVQSAGGRAEMLIAGGNPAEPDPLADGLHMQTISRLIEAFCRLSPRPTGLYVPEDLIAVSVYHELNQRGIRPGTDVDIVSCNNERPLLDLLHPRPATVDLFPEVVGRRAVEQLFWRRKNHDAPRSRILIEPQLVYPAKKE